MIRTYSELITIPTFEERFEYLKVPGRVGFETFGSARFINQALYTSDRWKTVRRKVIVRDNGCDLGIDGEEIYDMIIVHHMNPLTIDDILEARPIVFDMNGLISCADNTHKAIHYSRKELLKHRIAERTQWDTCPWRK